MNPEAAKRLRLLASVVSILLVVAFAAVGWFYSRVRASLPQLEGSVAVAGLSAAVTIERDALGVPTIRGRTRLDVARALGWAHAQDRFFQMDVLRRSASGELAEVFGPRAVARDRSVRIHGFRKLAEEVVGRLPAGDRALLDAYTAGVNTGLAALGARPFEYLVLRETPQPWRPEDTVLIAYAMTLDLQDGANNYEKTLMTLRDQLGAEGIAFFAPLLAPDDAAIDGSTAPLPPIPSPKMLDLRQPKVGATLRSPAELLHPFPPKRAAERLPHRDPFPFPARDPEFVVGSNAFALSGAHTATGAGLLANDMHLDHGVPNIWYRAVLEWPDPTTNELRRVAGVTLPGAPLVVAGSNGRVAWGFTDACADTGDLVIVQLVAGLESWYIVPHQKEAVRLETRRETIRVKGKDPVTVDYSWTIWGPIVGKNEKGQPLAFRWVAHDHTATGINLRAMEEAADVASAVAVAHAARMPAQNILIADSTGAIAWTIAGLLPKRVGYDGRLPVNWAFGDRRWDGFLAPDEVPAVVYPSGGQGSEPAKTGRLWSANHRTVGDRALARLGDGGYARPNRAAQIRDDLAPLERATPVDMLRTQLDDRAIFLTPWHKLLLDTLTPAVLEGKKPRAALRSFAEKWEGRASIEAVSYPIVKQFRLAVYDRVFTAIFASCTAANPDFNLRELRLEPALWAMLREKPPHLLPPQFASWDALLVAAADDTIAFLDKQAITLPHATWGLRNTARIRHPFSYSLPSWATGWLNLPADRLPGDVDMPRVQSPSNGASERFVVSPGRESEGIFHMPGGQSGHPLSPFFRAGHEAWVRGEPTPFLPGKTTHTLRLTP
ncbi:MAG: penicillin acylase family protein [Opitutaceae bacterium]